MGEITELDVDECLERARTGSVGRIALRTEAGLAIYPVNYVVDGESFVFRTLPYGVIANSAHDADVAFEVDRLDERTHAGWSVLAVGTCHRVEDPAEVRMLRDEHHPDAWAGGHRNLYFRVEWRSLTGRQVGAAPATPAETRTEAGTQATTQGAIPSSRTAPDAERGSASVTMGR